MPSRKSPDTSTGGIELSQVVKAAVVAIGANHDRSVNFESLRGLADTVGDDSLMKMFELSVAAKIELFKNGGRTPHWDDLYNQKIAVEKEVYNRILAPISDSPGVSEVSEESRRWLEASRELSALSSGLFGLIEALDIPKPSPSRKSKS